ncbi:MAG: serine hydroxymethyltransferase [Fervidicoccaceae archaeon]
MEGRALIYLEKAIELINEANRRRRLECLNLIASENVMSPLAEKAYLSDFMGRYAEGKPRKRFYQGTREIDELELMLQQMMGELLGTEMIESRPVSGTVANAAVFRALAQPGDVVLVAPVQAGSHVSHTEFGTVGALGLKQRELPYDADSMNVDVDGAARVIESVKPKFVILGGSVYLFPHPVREIAQVAATVGARVVYDGAHVLGLIVGKRWQNPLKLGGSALTASTHKTFPGPQGGLIAFSEEEVYKLVSKTIFPYFVSNHHLHRIPATIVTAAEMMVHGESYADQIVKNARRLAEALAEEGFKVVGERLGYTRSHQVLVDVSAQGGGAKVASILEEANIIVNKNLLPWDPPTAAANPSGIRIGVQEMTRYGMREQEMVEIAFLMRRVAIDGEDPAKVRSKVVELRKWFREVKYSLSSHELLNKLTSTLDLRA